MSKQVIKVQFANGDSHMSVNEAAQNLYHRQYDYFFVGETVTVRKGQYAVVEVSGIMKIVKVIGVGKFSGKANKYAIAVFDLESHQKRISVQEEIEALREAISCRAKEAMQRKHLEELAQSDSELATLLEQLKSLESAE